jgi:hypothetical protein
MYGKDALKKNHIEQLDDIIHLDRRAFWNERLLLCTFYPQKLGQLYCNWRYNTRRRRWIDPSGCDRHHLEGSTLIQMLPTQIILDLFKREFEVRSCMQRIDVDHLLPQ